MKETQVLMRKTTRKFILISSVILIVYFIILCLSGLILYPVLRYINYILIAIGIGLAFSEVKRNNIKHNSNYLPGLGMGFIIVFWSAIIFSLFVLLYARFIDQAFVNLIWPDPFYHNSDLNAYAIAVYSFSETLLFGVIMNLIVIQFVKRGNPSGSKWSW